MSTPLYRRTPAAERRLSMRARLTVFLCGMTALILLLVWGLTTFLLQPRYNRFIRTQLSQKADTLVSMIDSSPEPISERTFWKLKLNPEFWEQVNTAMNDGTLDVTNTCVEVSDVSLQYVNYAENLYPCLVHENRPAVGWSTSNLTDRDTDVAVKLREAVFDKGELYEIVSTSSDAAQMVVGRLSADKQYAVLVSTNLHQIRIAGMVMNQLLPVILGLVLLISLAASIWFGDWFTQPISELSAAARRIAKGDYSARVSRSGQDEMGQLAQDFNHMAAEVERTSQLQQELLANVSHDLRTPLTLIKGYAETIRDLTGNSAERRNSQLGIIIDETNRLSGLVNSVMELSRVRSGSQKPQLVEFDMAQLCSEVAERYEAVCAQNGWMLEVQADDVCPVQADPAMMERVLHNLLGNASHHLGADGWFAVRCLPTAGGCRVEVQDHGPGIAADDLPRIFDRYYRSRSDSGKTGTGLGLSITKAILQSHGADFGVDSTLGHGATFWFVLSSPAAKPAARLPAPGKGGAPS